MDVPPLLDAEPVGGQRSRPPPPPAGPARGHNDEGRPTMTPRTMPRSGLERQWGGTSPCHDRAPARSNAHERSGPIMPRTMPRSVEKRRWVRNAAALHPHLPARPEAMTMKGDPR
ncbi:hypothetical protein A9Q02_20705 [Candidatus Chloroploca asiatica]|uniref:Uncharacterized protein n=1 Tax=Candidatus Chloroploca asiatica TaxID=1506545 RepID=A0A2H3KFP2_9CHLR|nr:hypothetical protein A9Q02_20705 [Candidatus Chloroploca asiatica]